MKFVDDDDDDEFLPGIQYIAIPGNSRKGIPGGLGRLLIINMHCDLNEKLTFSMSAESIQHLANMVSR